MGKGTSPDRNRMVKEETIRLIKERALRSNDVTGQASEKVKSTVGMAVKALTTGMADLKEIGEEAQRKGAALVGAAQFSKLMG